MPYIRQGDRLTFDPMIQEITEELSIVDKTKMVGEINYIFTKILLGAFKNPRSYADYCYMVGTLENCKLELYRRQAAFYEDKKAQENGDVI